jgi:hypothetical protein
MDRSKEPSMPSISSTMRMLRPIVQHGLRELMAGSPPEHVLFETALMSWLVGRGMDAAHAMRYFEQHEGEWIGSPGVSRGEHPGAPGYPAQGMPSQMPYGQQMPYGKGAPGAMPYGKGAPGQMPYGKGAPAPMPFGKGAPGAMPYGKGAPAPMPFGKGLPMPMLPAPPWACGGGGYECECSCDCGPYMVRGMEVDLDDQSDLE